MFVFSDEMIFYAGLMVAGVSALLGIAYSVIYIVRKRRLKAKLDAEYGEAVKPK